MKKLILFFVVFLIFGSTTDTQPVLLKATKLQPLGADKVSVDLELHNRTDGNINYLGMYCSDSGFYVTDNPDVVVIPKPCNKNFPTTKTIIRNKYRTANVDLQVLKNTKQAKFKIGFRFTEIPKNVRIEDFDTASVKSVTIWSNEIEFKGR